MTANVGRVSALLSLWNDIDAARIDEYDAWHTLEHVPERVWVPGFLSGTRYIALGGMGKRYFTLYELGSLACLQSQAYRSLVEEPTPWSASMRPSFSNFLRKTGPIVASAGHSMGCATVLLRWICTPDEEPTSGALDTLATAMLQDAVATGAARVRIQRIEAAGPQAMSNADLAPPGLEFVLILESFRLDLIATLEDRARHVLVEHVQTRWIEVGGYRLASRFERDASASAARPAPRIDLMPR